MLGGDDTVKYLKKYDEIGELYLPKIDQWRSRFNSNTWIPFLPNTL
jgi:hypothetical protein